MTTVVRFIEAETTEPADVEAIGEAARRGDEAIVGGAIGYPRHWADFTFSAPTSITIRISEGRFFQDARFFDLEAAAVLNLLEHLPLVVGDDRYVAILARGVNEVEDRSRLIEVDVETRETVPTTVPKFDRHTVQFVVQRGEASPTPIKPAIAGTDCCVCFVRLSSAGIVSFEASHQHRVKTLYEVEGRVTVLEALMAVAFQRVQTLTTDMANVQARLKDIPRAELMRQLQRDAARTRRLLNLPDEARAYFYDAALVKDQWGMNDPLWLARIDEGVRFPWAAIRDEQLGVLNPAQADIRIEDEILMPKWSEKTRITVDGSGGNKTISQQVHTVTTPVQRQISRSSVSYGPTVAMCENIQEWSQIGQVRSGQTFQAQGETFEQLGAIDASYAGTAVDTSLFNQLHGSTWGFNDVVIHNNQVENQGGHLIYAARSVQVSSWVDTYWDYVTETFGINGSVYAQTFLLTQPMILTSIELKFTRVGADAVTLMLCEVSNVGTPMFDRVIARSTLQASAISEGWVRFPFSPRYLQPGRRYAWVTVTTGNHALATVNGSQFTQGTLFWSTDQAWFGGSQEEDFCFKINAAEFEVTRAVIDFRSLTLENGMTEIRLLYESWCPEGTSMMWEVKPDGATKWSELKPETAENPNPLRGLPPRCQIRVTMIGTSGIAPAIVLNNRARGETRRPRSDAKAPTKILNFGFATTAIQVELTIDQYVDAHHTVVPKIVVGGTTYTAATIAIAKDVSKITRRTLTANFNVPSTTSAKLLTEMQTTTVQSVCFLENVSQFAL